MLFFLNDSVIGDYWVLGLSDLCIFNCGRNVHIPLGLSNVFCVKGLGVLFLQLLFCYFKVEGSDFQLWTQLLHSMFVFERTHFVNKFLWCYFIIQREPFVYSVVWNIRSQLCKCFFHSEGDYFLLYSYDSYPIVTYNKQTLQQKWVSLLR